MSTGTIINHASAEAPTSEWMVPSVSYSPPAEV